MGDPRIIDIELDADTIMWRSDEVEQERRVAVTDLLAANYFAPERAYPQGYDGPFRVALSVAEGRLAIDVAARDGAPLETLVLSLTRFRRLIKDYFAICDSYFRAVRQASTQQIETIDMARRGVHNSAAELLRECLAGKIAVDFDTARRLFTLICVLHIRG
ncbi:UPF0262 family protein [Sphingomonas quercus]|uniref:UPF0262 protein KOF26_02105 n=1 Tax=Sphingomonas quercus TaxID=2842451 RepID=A0ABS6BFN5_9SPHN|nr:UPF0262 family protein [Sphingomonas quercus]MBU3076646.1 UPF0262 family protein [Sphingomonas quercus]